MEDKKKLAINEVSYVKLVSIGSINPNSPASESSVKGQADLLNRCLNDYPKGIIIGKDTSIGRYMIGEHELTMERVTYHVGFKRKPAWDEENIGSEEHGV